MKEGIADLEAWLQDTIHQGIVMLLEKQPNYWSEFASRMVDTKISGIGRIINKIRDLPQDELWADRVLNEISRMHLACRAFHKIWFLDDDTQADLLTFLGVNIRKKDLPLEAGLQDIWLVIGVRQYQDFGLTARNVWMIGIENRVMVVVKEYVWGDEGFDFEYKTGWAYSGRIIFYPGAFPMRAAFSLVGEGKNQHTNLIGYKALPNWDAALNQLAHVIGKNPWWTDCPMLLEGISIRKEADDWLIYDENHLTIPVQASDKTKWKWLAASQGQQCTFFGEWNGNFVEPLCLITDKFIDLSDQ